jgi:hypothetical protein
MKFQQHTRMLLRKWAAHLLPTYLHPAVMLLVVKKTFIIHIIQQLVKKSKGAVLSIGDLWLAMKSCHPTIQRHISCQ